MTPNDIVGRYFLVGCVRSGTTLLTALLSSHSEVASFPETMFFRYLVGNAGVRFYDLPPANARDLMRTVYHDLRTHAGFASPAGERRVRAFLSEIGRDDLAASFQPGSRSMARQVDACLTILDTLAAEQGKRRWIEKSPDHVAYTDEIARYVRPTRFLHILRNGPDNIASIYDAAQKYPDTHWRTCWGTVDRCISQWKRCVRLSLANEGDPDHCLVHYDDLVRDTPATLRRICEFLGIPYERAMLENYARSARGIVLEQSSWKNGVFGAIQSDRSKFGIFTPEQQRHILDSIQDIPIPALIRTPEAAVMVG